MIWCMDRQNLRILIFVQGIGVGKPVGGFSTDSIAFAMASDRTILINSPHKLVDFYVSRSIHTTNQGKHG